MIPTRTHGVLDYVVGALLILAPFLFGFADGTAAQWVPTLLGIAAIVYSLVTRYELSIAKLLPMPAHLALDALSGVLLAASPWLFGFADRIWWPHVTFGLLEIVVSALTRRHAPAQSGPLA